ncbi:tautomerase family protein [Planotetraspora phitsanulokensis]|uniref:tautomerase family protein n=1 Tax=Planotetraspora phitsanulokensis TaxID=575192 RepID=UPI001EF39761|nr:tautomerase family protein [Planotetraspora phitsanulokensis]
MQIDLDRSLAERLGEQISDGIHQALVDGLGMDPTDKFQIFRTHAPGEIVFDPGYNGVDRRQLVSIQILMVHMYDVTTKYAMFDQIAKRLEEIGIRPDDLLISIVENGFEDWYAGKSRS